MDTNQRKLSLSRKDFLKTSAAVAATASASGVTTSAFAFSKPNAVPGGIQRYRRLGDTPYYISDVGFGAGDLQDPNTVLYAIDKGINYFDTAPDYGDSELNIGKALKVRKAMRSKLVITTKMCRPTGYPGHLKAASSTSQIIAEVEASLKRMQTDYIDFLLVHALSENPARLGSYRRRLGSEAMLDAAQKLKAQGKIRYIGFSEHSSDNLATTIAYAQARGFKLVMPASWTWRKNQSAVFQAMRKGTSQKGMGFVSMKVLKVRKEGVQAVLNAGGSADELDRACIKWVNARGPITAAVLTCSTRSKIDRFVKASGQDLSFFDRQLIDTYDRALAKNSTNHCDFTCAAPCQDTCPGSVQVQSIMRMAMYDKDYGSRRYAKLHYQQLLPEETASACATCNAPCSGPCPGGLNIRKTMTAMHTRLT